jgi:hypothetical protein
MRAGFTIRPSRVRPSLPQTPDASRPHEPLVRFDVFVEGVVVGRIFKANAAPVGEQYSLSASVTGFDNSAESRTEPPSVRF